jgi:hypothetical protein
LFEDVVNDNGFTQFKANTWYEGLEVRGNTSVNPFFYGTYLAETKPNEPVTRTKGQAFQADALGVVHQLTPAHFKKPHTIRLEWQPGRGGRLDWFVKSYKLNETASMEGDGNGEDWTRVFTIKDKSLEDVTGAQIPAEPSHLIMNTAVSSTWGFPTPPETCAKCYDCNDPRCACAFYPGFCKMLESRKTAMYIDHIRVYQSRDDSAHVGLPHTLGCDPPKYPTREWITGHEYRYMRNPPFVYSDLKPLRKVTNGGGSCKKHSDCGGDLRTANLTEAYVNSDSSSSTTSARRTDETEESSGHGKCSHKLGGGMFSLFKPVGLICSCNEGYTGPHCMSLDHIDESPSAYDVHHKRSPFLNIHQFEVPLFMMVTIVIMSTLLLAFLVKRALDKKKYREMKDFHSKAVLRDNQIRSNVSSISGTSIS